jgi:hypothetical protein
MAVAAPVDAQVYAWGRNDSGQCEVPATVGRITQLSAGGKHAAALNSFLGLTMWGSNTYGQCNVPAGVRITAIALGGEHSVAITGGAVRCWGRNTFGQCNVPDGLEGIIAVGAGANHSIAVSGSRFVRCWGLWSTGNVPDTVQGHAISVDGGYEHSLALLDDGSVGAWGRNDSGQCNVPIGLRGAISIATGDYFSLALHSSGTVRAWGDNASGQCNVPGWLSGVTRIDAGANHAIALRSDGAVVTWGSNSYGQCQPPGGLVRAEAIAAGADHALAVQPLTIPSGPPWIVTVDPGGSTAFRTIQQAIDASPINRPVTIRIRPGTYTGTEDAIVKVIDRSVELVSTDGAEVTVIDGQHARRGILCASGYGASLTVSGITFSRCRGLSLGHPFMFDARGGGIRAEGAPGVQVAGCRFIDCMTSPTESQSDGSGIWYRGIWAQLDGSPPSPPPPPCRITNCLFERCERGGFGSDGWGVVVESSTFRQCRMGWGPAILAAPGITVEGCLFEANEGTNLGGAVSIVYGRGRTTVTNCSFIGNRSLQGGAMFFAGNNNSTPSSVARDRISNCTFIGNEAVGAGASGGALHQCAWTDIENCTFVGNRGLFGRAIRGASWRPPRLAGCTFDTCCPAWPPNGVEWGKGNSYEPRCTGCVGDLECDGLVDGNDLGVLLGRWGASTSTNTADINGDGFVDGTDLGELLATWGVCPQG